MNGTQSESSYQYSHKGERLPLLPAESCAGRVNIHVPTISRAGIGCITSRERGQIGFWELKALELGCTVAEAKRRAMA
jgi:hypothetical protein